MILKYVLICLFLSTLFVSSSSKRLLNSDLEMDLLQAKFYVANLGSKLIPQFMCFKAEVPRDIPEKVLASRRNVEYAQEWAIKQLKNRKGKPVDPGTVPQCPKITPCIKELFDYPFPESNEGMTLFDIINVITQHTFVVNFPGSCENCEKLVNFVTEYPNHISSLNGEPGMNKNMNSWLYCLPLVKTNDYVMSDNLKVHLHLMLIEDINKALELENEDENDD